MEFAETIDQGVDTQEDLITLAKAVEIEESMEKEDKLQEIGDDGTCLHDKNIEFSGIIIGEVVEEVLGA
ncbi:hypothetical protein GOP47_0010138 [Adiantum capillus-veneris]|uniref:Uncharacterized protein n=1 Tax=Adiantum capillus-veneris TaxID=13818 RepID=A0A9D4ZHE1_ADICA|nr:hypothetical protein GOP47_0010038 [Adiantum capillus-veneris]KAI5074177.1 hypothetical protein GOP47_0010138 [Adiantum capillus-veneris]